VHASKAKWVQVRAVTHTVCTWDVHAWGCGQVLTAVHSGSSCYCKL
jgi:hypothetical protein